jgi:hypothetical protein
MRLKEDTVETVYLVSGEPSLDVDDEELGDEILGRGTDGAPVFGGKIVRAGHDALKHFPGERRDSIAWKKEPNEKETKLAHGIVSP